MPEADGGLPSRDVTVGGVSGVERLILESLQDGVILFDADGGIRYANPAAEQILGAPAGELERGLRSWEPLGPDLEPLPDDAWPVPVTASTGRPARSDLLGLRRADGSLRWLTVSSQAIGEPAEPGGRRSVAVSFTDVTERRQAQEALERSNAELAQFAYVASHDLSEPLRMVSSYLQLLRRRYHGELDEDADEFIDYAVEGANRMRALIDDLLAYSRAGRAAEPTPVDAELVVGQVLSSLAPAIVEARAHVHVGPLPMVLGDRLALAQLLQNLIANALKFRRGPGTSVWVDAEREGAGTWRLSVADDGIGIRPGHHERVFKMFQRLHDHDAFEGTGIGLAICRKIVDRLGGAIWAEDRPGGGTVFHFTVPAVPVPVAVPPLEAHESARA